MRNQGRLWLAALLVGAAATSAQATCSFGPGTPHEPSLQQVFDAALGAGVVDAANDCIADAADALWTAPNGVKFVLGAEIAGFAASNVFGVFDATNPSTRLPVFLGGDGPGRNATLSIAATTGGFRFSVTRDGATTSAVFGSSVFGLYLKTPQHNVFFSDTGLNADHTDHLYAYDSVTEFIEACFGHRSVLLGPGTVLLAFEDLFQGGDGDFQDMVLAASGLTPVPLPAALWLFASALAGLIAVRARRQAH